ncbi:MAG: hypothetical protein NVS2B8_09080 [Vulcanimicrobiaceae bacterium]
MAAMKLRIVRPVARACALLALTLAAGCGGGARSGNVPPAPTVASKDASVTFPLTTERTAHALPSVGGYGGRVTLRTTVPVAGATLRVASSTDAPASAALAQRMKRLQTGTLAVLFYATFTPSVTVTLAELPSFSIDLRGDVATAERQFFYGISDPSATDAVIAFRTEGPAAVAGTTLAFDSSPTPLTLEAGQSYVFVFYATTTAATAGRGQTEQLAPGVSYTHVERPATTAPSYAVDAGFRTTLAAAQSLAAAYAPAGYTPRIVPIAQRPTDLPGTGPFGYLVRVSEYSVVDDANAVATKLKAAGLAASVAATNLDGLTQTTGPLVVDILTIDPGQFHGTLTPALATGVVKGLDRTSNIAARANAIAAVNGGYFVIGEADGTPGDAAGISVIDGELVSEAVNGRTSLLVRPDGHASIDALTTRDTETSSDGATAPLTGLNRKLGLKRSCGGDAGEVPTIAPKHDFTCTRADDLVLFTPKFGTSTDTGAGYEVVLDASHHVTATSDTRGSTIPSDGSVVAAIGGSQEWLRAHAPIGAQLTAHTAVLGEAGAVDIGDHLGIVNGGPRLVRSGRVDIDGTAEGFEYPTAMDGDFYYGFGIRRNPRTLAGITADGRLLLVTADGRQPTYSIGLSFIESAALMQSLGAVDAVNLDGGGSSTFVAHGRLINRPSDTTGERPVGNAILVLP